MKLFEELKEDFNLFRNNNDLYINKVNNISELLNLKNTSKLREDYLPTYFVGNYKKNNMYILFSMNPGFNEEQNKKEESLKNQTFEKYENFMINFYKLFYENSLKSRYYTRISNLFSGIENTPLSSQKEIYNFFQENLINIDLIPYHSTSFGLANNLSKEQNLYIKQRFESVMEFVSSINSKLIIFNGKEHLKLLDEYNYLENAKIHDINDRVKLYVFYINSVPCILFSKMITQAGTGIKNEHMREIIAKIIKKHLNIL